MYTLKTSDYGNNPTSSKTLSSAGVLVYMPAGLSACLQECADPWGSVVSQKRCTFTDGASSWPCFMLNIPVLFMLLLQCLPLNILFLATL